MKIATAAYPLSFLADWYEYAAKQRQWVSAAADEGADLLVFPEYGAMELSSLGGANVAADTELAMAKTAALYPDAVDLLAALAAEFNVHILAPSGPVFDGKPRPVNRAALIGPSGVLGYQDKQIMVPFERSALDMVPGDGQFLFAIAGLNIGVTICYDTEFPLLGRNLAEAGADIILAPSCTETQAGWTRVRVAAMARALENQCVTVVAPLIGECAWCAVVEAGFGAAGVYGPADAGFPANGVLAEGTPNAPGWVFAELDRAAIAHVRAQGTVLNHQHWSEQHSRIKSPVFVGKNPENS